MGSVPQTVSEPRLRSVIDTIALEVLPRKGGELDDLISDRTMDYLLKLRGEQPTLSDHEIDRVARAIVRGVLKRLLQIAQCGGQLGTG